jgi:zinc/manganese transport system substrate-binding protein
MILIRGGRSLRRTASRVWLFALSGVVAGSGFFAGCGQRRPSDGGTASIVVTHSILGSLVKDVVGDQGTVTVLIPNGSDPHDWDPSAKDIERLNHATLVVRNGLNLEQGLNDALDRAAEKGVPTFVASDHITIRKVGKGEGLPNGDPDQVVGAMDPHLWMDPLTLRDVVLALAPALSAQGIDVSSGVRAVATQLERLNDDVSAVLDQIPGGSRKLVTGHESLGYFARRYQFRLVGAIVPSLNSQAGVSAKDLALLSGKIREQHVGAVFTELGTPKQIAESIGTETGVRVVELATHTLPPDGRYATFLMDDAVKIAAALSGT